MLDEQANSLQLFGHGINSFLMTEEATTQITFWRTFSNFKFRAESTNTQLCIYPEKFCQRLKLECQNLPSIIILLPHDDVAFDDLGDGRWRWR